MCTFKLHLNIDMDKQFKINAFWTGLAKFVTFEEKEWEILTQYLSFSTLK